MCTIKGFDTISHLEEHRYYFSKVLDLQKKLYSGQNITFELFDFMKEWVLNHIMISDQKIGKLYQPKDSI